MSSIASSTTQVDFRVKWNNYYLLPSAFGIENYIEQLTPLSNLPEFKSFTELEKQRFFIEYLKLVSESLIFFEQILVLGAWDLLKKNDKLLNETKAALKQFAVEELFHSQAFRHFLHIHPDFNWNQCKIYSDAKIIRKFIVRIIHFAPAAVFIPGAKLEAFTLCYYKMIKNFYPKQQENSWIHLNQLHQIDEAHHVALEFDLHNSIINRAGVMRTILGGALFIAVMQIALFKGAYLVVKRSFPNRSIIEKLGLTFKMAKWAVRTNVAYSDARIMTKKLFKSKRPKYGIFWKYIYW